jgi:transcriptional regulator GlxA family with amidase domain
MPQPRPGTIQQRTALFEDATHVVETDFARDLNLNDVARRIATSRRQLQRIYLEIGHTTFREQLTRVRMERAARMLGVNGVTVREVAARVGYRQPAQFAKAFRAHHGVSPSEYRRLLAERMQAAAAQGQSRP